MNSYPQKRKGTKANGFFVFALEFKKKLHDQGFRIQNIRQIMEMAAPHWEKLSAEEKEDFKIRARISDEDMSYNPVQKRRKLNCVGQEIDEMQLSLDVSQKTYKNMTQEIKDLVSDAQERGELEDTVFHFISATSFHEDETDVFPAELAIAKFSLKQGIISDWQIRINPGQLPLGSSRQATEKAEKIHRYPLPPNCEGESDYLTILEEMIKFLHPLDELPIFFAYGNTRDDKSVLQETLKIVDKIFYEAHESDLMSTVKIYPLDEFLFVLHQATTLNKNRLNDTKDPPFPSISFASSKLNDIEFLYMTPGCEFHNQLDVTDNCCLSEVRRSGYVLARWCSDGGKYELKRGSHFPMAFKESQKEK